MYICDCNPIFIIDKPDFYHNIAVAGDWLLVFRCLSRLSLALGLSLALFLSPSISLVPFLFAHCILRLTRFTLFLFVDLSLLYVHLFIACALSTRTVPHFISLSNPFSWCIFRIKLNSIAWKSGEIRTNKYLLIGLSNVTISMDWLFCALHTHIHTSNLKLQNTNRI